MLFKSEHVLFIWRRLLRGLCLHENGRLKRENFETIHNYDDEHKVLGRMVKPIMELYYPCLEVRECGGKGLRLGRASNRIKGQILSRSRQL